MEIHQLRYFCAVAFHGSFTRAADAEHVAQPSLSQQIQKLEHELGMRLFDRLPRAAALTEAGRVFLPRARAILRQLADAKCEVQGLSGIECGELVVGTIPTIAPYFLPPVLAGFVRSFPGVLVRVVEDVTHALVRHMYERRLDVCILTLPAPGTDFETLQLLNEPLFAVVPERHHLASCRRIDLQRLRDEPFLLLKEGHCFRENVIAACESARVAPHVVFESGQFATILAMVAAGMGVSVVPQMAVESTTGCCFIPIEGQSSVRRVGAVRLRQHSPTRAESLFLDWLAAAKRGRGFAPAVSDRRARSA
jgi:LysR family hydrogen peroxide-inducible transcriptional activator